jgi:hypothetical protein
MLDMEFQEIYFTTVQLLHLVKLLLLIHLFQEILLGLQLQAGEILPLLMMVLLLQKLKD